MPDELLISSAERLGQHMRKAGHRLALAESCTGGWIAQSVTEIAGSSMWFDRGFVTYSN
ncbi:MAG: CinA family protein, partial [Gammaproteobacteria bacterium]